MTGNNVTESELDESHTYPVKTKGEDVELGTFDRYALRLFGDYFKERRDQFSGFQKTLKQAQMSDGYHLYLSRVLLWFFVLTGLSMAVAGIATAGLFGLFPDISLGLQLSFTIPSLPKKITQTVAKVGPALVGGFLFLLLTFLMAGIPTLTMYLIPWYRSGEREREIDTMIPYTVTFMYALSRGGANLINVMETVAESKDVYGESANEFQTIVRDMEFFDSDLRSALRDAANTSPSQSFTDFIDDLVSIVDTGGDLEAFMYDKTEEYLLEARREQENFLDTLSLMGEIYVTAFVAGPLFIIIIMTVMALIGGSSIFMLNTIIYGVLPLGNLGFAFLVDVMKSGKTAESEIKEAGYEFELDKLEELKDQYDDTRVADLYKTKKRNDLKETVFNPYETFRNHPSWTLTITLPLSIAYLGIAYFLFGIPFGNLVDKAVQLTAVYAVAPMFLWLLPISIFHELKIRRKGRILRKIPNMLKKMSSANATGMSLEESFEIVADSTGGELGTELHRVKNDIDWRGDLNEALLRFAKRIDTPRLARTVKLITKAARSTGNITSVIDVAAKDVQQTHRLEKDRKQEMAMYTVIIIVSFLVYLLVIVMLNEAFLGKIATLGKSGAGASGSKKISGGAGFNISDMPINMYNMVFYHSTVIQAFGAGLIAGQMGSDDMLAGLKFSLAMIAISTVVFLLI